MITVEQAAIFYKGMVYSVPKPGRHNHVINYMSTVFGPDWKLIGGEQGFLLSDGSFVDREKAWDYAVLANQLLPRAPTDGNGGVLYSEDVW